MVEIWTKSVKDDWVISNKTFASAADYPQNNANNSTMGPPISIKFEDNIRKDMCLICSDFGADRSKVTN